MRFELFESDGSRWLCKNISARGQRIMYEDVGKKKKILYSVVLGSDWYWGAI
jgi:hypothetical protein